MFALIWRRRWDLNPRAPEDNLISSQARYDLFDTSPQYYIYYQKTYFCSITNYNFVKSMFSICLRKIKGFNIKLKYIRFFIILWYNIRIGTVVETMDFRQNYIIVYS